MDAMAALRTTMIVFITAVSLAIAGAHLKRSQPHFYFFGSYWNHPIP
jgi:hypothetical protein